MTLGKITSQVVLIVFVPSAFSQSLSDVTRLKEIVAAQDWQISQQQEELSRLRAIVDEHRRIVSDAIGVPPGRTQTTPIPQAGPDSGQRESAQKTGEHPSLSLNASQEVRFSEASPTLKLGPADIRLQGYVALAGLFDTANVGGSIGTNFAGIPYSDTAEGNSSEFRLSSQRTRVAIRVDTKMTDADLRAYLEADFRGTTSGTVAVTSSSFGFRVRQAGIDYQRRKLSISSGLCPIWSPMAKASRCCFALPGNWGGDHRFQHRPGIC
jgi:hypothetical protein